MLNVAIRCDASIQIGSGHVVRCLTLANALRGKGANVEFITRAHTGNMNERIKSEDFKVQLLPDMNNINSQPDLSGYEQWLGVKQDSDADDTIQILADRKLDWLIIDHYALDKRWERKLNKYARKMMVIDDIANRVHDCDLLLDQNLYTNMSTRYHDKIPTNCVQMLGPQYALLQHEYAELRALVKPRQAPVSRLLVFFGGIDRKNLTGLTISALQEINIPFDEVDIVISKQSPNFDQVKAQSMQSDKLKLHSDLPSLAPLMMKADLAIGGGGSTTWERCCLGLPSLVITLAENQKQLSQDMQQMKLIACLGDAETIRIEQITLAINNVLSCTGISDWSQQCMAICPGNGTNLVVDAMLEMQIE